MYDGASNRWASASFVFFLVFSLFCIDILLNWALWNKASLFALRRRGWGWQQQGKKTRETKTTISFNFSVSSLPGRWYWYCQGYDQVYRYKSILLRLQADKSKRVLDTPFVSVSEESVYLSNVLSLSFLQHLARRRSGCWLRSIFLNINSFFFFLISFLKCTHRKYWLKHFTLSSPFEFTRQYTLQIRQHKITMEKKETIIPEKEKKNDNDGKKWIRSRQRPNAE